ncbi:glycosyltransferase family 4 protein [Vibrio vulnificus]|nr:glycosyltransferase family 4 protein [Vibrio vulnificus]
MKINFYISNLRSGGTQRVTTLLASAFSCVHDVNICVNDLSDEPYFSLPANVNLVDMQFEKNHTGFFSRLFNNLILMFKLRKQIIVDDPEVIIAQQVEQCIRLSISSIFLNKTVICCEHSEYYAIKSKLARFFRTLVYYLFVDNLFVLTEIDKFQYPKLIQKKITVMPNPLSYHAELDYERMKKKKENLIISVGRLSKEKGFERLIDFISKNRDIFINWRVEIIGDGDEFDTLNRQIDKLNVGDIVCLVGQVKNVEDYYERSSIYVMTSIYEGFGLVLIEAMQSFNPVLAFNSSIGAREIVRNEQNGFLVDDNDWVNFRECLSLLMNNSALRSSLAIEAHRNSNFYSVENITNKWSTFFK